MEVLTFFILTVLVSAAVIGLIILAINAIVSSFNKSETKKINDEEIKVGDTWTITFWAKIKKLPAQTEEIELASVGEKNKIFYGPYGCMNVKVSLQGNNCQPSCGDTCVPHKANEVRSFCNTTNMIEGEWYFFGWSQDKGMRRIVNSAIYGRPPNTELELLRLPAEMCNSFINIGNGIVKFSTSQDIEFSDIKVQDQSMSYEQMENLYNTTKA